MGRKSAQKDRGYLTTTEWKNEWGGHKGSKRIPFQRLPFHCCAITFTPFEDPVATDDGTVYDVTNIVPYVMKYKRHPVNGQPLSLKELIRLNFHKNAEGLYDCPVTGKVFTAHTHIAAIKKTGNVYAYEALDELCIKPKSWKDLLTDEPFTRKDIITLQDPLNSQARTIGEFDHVKQGLVLDDDEEEEGGGSNLRNVTEDMKRALGALQTSEAKAAFDAGGGGKRAEALRLLAAAKNLNAKKAEDKDKEKDGNAARAASGNAASTSGPSGPSAAGGSGASEGDWRLRAPERDSSAVPRFRPGAATWDTDDYMTQDGKALKKKEERMATMVATAGYKTESAKEAVAAAVKAGGAGGSKSGLTPQERYEAGGHVKYVESFTSTGKMAQSFTSTYATVHTKANRQLVRKDRNPDKKGYLRLHTNMGDLNIELHCDIVPRTCENFIALCVMGYYDGTIFHRSIKNFMIQGGDPTGTGLGGESIYGKTFKDELDSRLTHSGRGILSMANSGPGTNGSQFFIAYKSCRHLDFKHSVFGRVVGGLEVLTTMEHVDTDEDDRPKQEMKITGVTVFTNPFQEMEDAEAAEAEAARKADALQEATRTRTGEGQVGKWYSAPAGETPSTGEEGKGVGGVGRYLAAALAGTSGGVDIGGGDDGVFKAPAPRSVTGGDEPAAKKPKVVAKSSSALTNFDAW